MATDQRVQYLKTHNVPELLDALVGRLLASTPDDPVAYLQKLDWNNLLDRAPSPYGARSASPSALRHRPEGGSPMPESQSESVRFGESVEEFADAPQGSFRIEKRSFREDKKPAEHKVSKEDAGRIKQFRKKFFDSYADNNWETGSNIRCAHIGCIALAMSYLMKGLKTASPSDRVTTEDVFFHARLPLYYASNSGITLAELYDIFVKFVKRDPRFANMIDVALVGFDTRFSASVGDSGCTEQMAAVSLPQFRSYLEKDTKCDKRIRIFNFDPYIAEQSSQGSQDDEEEDEAEVKNRMPAAHKKNRGAYGVFTEFNAFKHAVKLSECYIDEEVKIRFREVLMTALYRSCSANDRFNKRPRGYILAGENASGEADTDELPSQWTAKLCIDDELLDGISKTSKGTSVMDTANDISPHLIAVAFALHLIHGQVGCGLRIGDILSVNHMPLHIAISESMPLDQVYLYAKTYLVKKNLSSKYLLGMCKIEECEGAGDSVPAVSVMDLENFIIAATNANTDPKEPSVVMLVNFDVCTVHSTWGLDQGSVPSHWGVVASYDPSDQVVRIADIMPKKFCKYWSVPLDRLHTGATGKGFLVICTPEGSKAMSGVSFAASDSIAVDYKKALPVTSEATGSTFEFPKSVFCISVIACALTKLVVPWLLPLSVEDVVHGSGLDISYLLSDHISLMDIRRIAMYVIEERKMQVHVEAHVFDNGVSGKPHCTLDEFAAMLHTASPEQSPTHRESVIVVNYNAERVQLENNFLHHSGGDYAVVLSYDAEKKLVTCCDLNPLKYYRTWSVELASLYTACKDADYVSKRARGLLIFTKGAPAASGGRGFDIRGIKNRHPLKAPTSPQISAVAFALSELGRVSSAEDIFYTSYDKIKNSYPELFKLNTLRSTWTIPRMEDASKAFMSKYNIAKSVQGYPVDPHSVGVHKFEEDVKRMFTENRVIVVVYNTTDIHDIKGSVGAGLIKDLKGDTVTVADVNTTELPHEWSCSLPALYKACSGPGSARGLLTYW